MRSRARRIDPWDLVEVEIGDAADDRDDEGDEGDRDDAAPGPRSASADGPRAGRYRLAGGVAVVLVLAVVVGANVMEARREAATVAALAGVDHLVRDLSEPPEVLWTIEGGYVMAETESLLVLLDGSGGMVGVDPLTGDAVWTRPWDGAEGFSESCQPWVEGGAGIVRFEAEMLLCADQSHLGGLPEPGHRTQVESVDVSSGAAVGTLRVEGALAATSIGGARSVLVSVDASGRVHVVSWDPVTGQEAWRHRGSPGMLTDTQTASVSVHAGAVRVTRYDMTVDGTGAEVELVVLDAETGEPAPPDDRDASVPWFAEIELPDGGTMHVTSGRDSGLRLVVTDAGEPRFEVLGWPWVFEADDGSVPDVLVVLGEDGVTRGLDARDGSVRWERTEPDPAQSLFRLRGVAVLVDPASTEAVDLVTGETLWSRERAAQDYGAATDGRRVVIADYVEGGSALVALDLDDGEELWRLPVAGSSSVRGAGGVLLVETGSTITAFG